MVLGEELVTNGDFSVEAGWAYNDGWAWAEATEEAEWSSEGASDYEWFSSAEDLVIQAGTVYRVSYEIKISAGFNFSFYAKLGGQLGAEKTSIGTYTEDITARNDDSLIQFGIKYISGGRNYIQVDDVSVKEIIQGFVG